MAGLVFNVDLTSSVLRLRRSISHPNSSQCGRTLFIHVIISMHAVYLAPPTFRASRSRGDIQHGPARYACYAWWRITASSSLVVCTVQRLPQIFLFILLSHFTCLSKTLVDFSEFIENIGDSLKAASISASLRTTQPQ